MVKLIKRARSKDESALYARIRFTSWRETTEWPRWDALFCFPWKATTETLDLDYFQESAQSKFGFDIDPVAYQRPGSHVTHTYNPVTHYKLNGSILADEAAEERIELEDDEANLLSASKYVPVIPILPGQTFSRTFEKRYYSEQRGKEVLFHGKVYLKRSPIKRIKMQSNREPNMYTLVSYLAVGGPEEYEDWIESKNLFHNTVWAGCLLLINPDVPSYQYRDVLYYALKQEDLPDHIYANKATWNAEVHKLETLVNMNTMLMRQSIRAIVPSSTRPSWIRFVDLERKSALYNIEGIWYATNGVLLHPGSDQTIRSALKNWNWSPYEDYVHNCLEPLEWNHRCFDALQNIGEGAQVNGIAFIKDAIEMGPTVKAFISTLRSVPSKKVKAIASAWLAVHYGFKLTVLDSKELYDELTTGKHAGFGLSNARSMRTFWPNARTCVTIRYQVIFDRFRNLTEILGGFLREVDLTLSLENIWDMIPFSFVVDWFVKIGDMFNAIDNYYSVRSYYTTAAAGQSITLSGPVNLTDPSVTDLGDLSVNMYIRAYNKTPVLPIPSHTTVTPLSHWVEGAALIIANR